MGYTVVKHELYFIAVILRQVTTFRANSIHGEHLHVILLGGHLANRRQGKARPCGKARSRIPPGPEKVKGREKLYKEPVCALVFCKLFLFPLRSTLDCLRSGGGGQPEAKAPQRFRLISIMNSTRQTAPGKGATNRKRAAGANPSTIFYHRKKANRNRRSIQRCFSKRH